MRYHDKHVGVNVSRLMKLNNRISSELDMFEIHSWSREQRVSWVKTLYYTTSDNANIFTGISYAASCDDSHPPPHTATFEYNSVREYII